MGHRFIIDESSTDNETTTISLVTTADENTYCFLVVKSKDDIYTTIQNLEYHPECASNKLPEKGGTIIISLLLTYLVQNKKRLNISRVLLTDNSFIYCDGCKETLRLAPLYTLTQGDTWYGKFGFRPYNTDTNSPDEDLRRKYIKNKKLMDTLLLKDVNLIALMAKIGKKNKYNLDIMKRNLKIVKEIESKYKNRKLKTILKYLSKRDCCFMALILNKFMKVLRLTNFYQHSFYLDI